MTHVLNYTFVDLDITSFTDYSESVYWNQEVPFAIFVAIYCLFFIVLHFLVIKVLLSDRELRKLSAYQLIGAIMNSSWVTMLLLSILLNINRFVSIVFNFSPIKWFSTFLMKIYFSIILLIWLIVFIIDMSSLSHMVYLLPTYTWHYVADYDYSKNIRTFSANISLIDVLASLFSHLIIFSYIFLKAAILSRRELILTFQVLGISCFHVFGYLTWEYMPIPYEKPIGLFLSHFVWMVWNSINPALYIIINPRIRQLVLSTIGIRKHSMPSHISFVRSSSRFIN